MMPMRMCFEPIKKEDKNVSEIIIQMNKKRNTKVMERKNFSNS